MVRFSPSRLGMFIGLLLGASGLPAGAQTTRPAIAAGDLPTEWIDPGTGHRVIRLSRENGSLSLYFHQNAYTPDGKKLLITAPSGLYSIDLDTRQIEKVLPDPHKMIMVGRKTGDMYFSRTPASGGPASIYAVDVKTHETRKVATLPEIPNATVSIATVNADETLLAGSVTYPPAPAPGRVGPTTVPAFRYTASGLIDTTYRRSLHLPMDLMTIDTRSGEVKLFNHSTEWLNHIQFSPTDPKMLMFCHGGPWQAVDQIWTIDVKAGAEAQLVHDRTMLNEIAGHEFWSADGNSVWYDLQTPIGQVFWLAGKNLQTGVRTWYPVARNEWSVHFNISPDGSLFAGDGSGPDGVAGPGHGQWIYLFRPVVPAARGPGSAPIPYELRPPLPDTERDQSHLIVPGRLQAERLVNLAKHNYKLEPNVTFTPNMKWIVFRSNMLGPAHVFAVEIAKAK